ncbi:hypothetical protein H7X65_02265 [Candidatus Parcubacteria bacterium]|nr:hypothetical protein [Candidatus Parcubacteria bacterium]
MKFTILGITGSNNENVHNLIGKSQCRIYNDDKVLDEAIGGLYGHSDRHSVLYGCFRAKLDRIEGGPIPDTAALVVIDHPNEVTIIVSTQDGPLTEAQLDLVAQSQVLHATA